MSKKPVVAGSTSLKVCIYIYAPHDDKNSLGQRLICCFSSQRLLQTCKIPTAYLQSFFRSSRYSRSLSLSSCPCITWLFHDIGSPPPSTFCNISCCVSRHEIVELMLSSPTFLKFDSWWYWLSIAFRGAHSLVQLGQAPREDICSTVLVRRTVCQ